ncbi:monovalent cation:proton antiporter-2 (CPA2) family protein [Pontibaca methylaminivorans]|uniref:Kef-type potassium/proton antiporter, CPA2 family n=1 Tax=Pontibaca methylaminivorans TaxID=515897 RepID=A0A1R3WIZ2_9RHOB|nr:monovalent cation:proton antiporter-2 (CPA2) family protein [Pontibaca methylaminivorans]SIT77234.1 Kef-type potassium/proton antiporter, CPA2 family [Pontibaca methylaminivorans]
MEIFLYQASIYLAAAVIAVPFAARLGLGSVLGYLAAGIIIGPVLGLVGAETEELQHIAEFGVVMMLFLIGLEIEPLALWSMRRRMFGLGGAQVLLTALVLMGAAMLLGQPWQTGLAIGLTLALSSTAIVLQTLSEKGLIQTRGGRSIFAVLLMQDLAVIPILALMPLLAVGARSASPEQIAAEAQEKAFSIVDGLPGWEVTLITAGAIGAVILSGIYLTRPLFRYIHAANLREMYTALALLIVVAISFLMTLVGLSPALGAFLAGVVLANTEFRHELESDLNPFKGLLLGLFFITVGAGMNFNAFFQEADNLVELALLVILVKGSVLYLLGRLSGLKGRDRWLFSLSLAQAGEFGFVLVAFAGQVGVFSDRLADEMLMIITLSMLITPLLFILYNVVSARITDPKRELPPDTIDFQAAVIIAGVGRFGQIVNRLVRASGFRTVVLDSDMDKIQLMRRFGFKGFLGDPTRPELLDAAGLARARVLVAAMDGREKITRLVTYARRQRPDLHIIARAYDRSHAYELYRAGANDIVREMFDSSLRAGRYVLENVGLTEFEAATAARTFSAHDRHALQQLAEVWNPDIPATQNTAYIERMRALQQELETELLNQVRGKAPPPETPPEPAPESA